MKFKKTALKYADNFQEWCKIMHDAENPGTEKAHEK